MGAKSFEPRAGRVSARIKLFVLARDYFIVAMVSMCGIGSSYADPPPWVSHKKGQYGNIDDKDEQLASC